MMTVTHTDAAVDRTLAILDEALGTSETPRFGFRLWDGTTWGATGSDAAFTVVLKHPGSLRAMFVPPTELNAGEAYIYDDFDVEGDMEAVAGLAETLADLARQPATIARLTTSMLRLPHPQTNRDGRRRAGLAGAAHSKGRDVAAVRHHYDVSNDFYSLWLDRRMVYSCAYFADADEPLEIAQQRKLDYICAKLRLQPGDRLLDIGCGWGGLLMHAAKRCGAIATGITLSEPQAALANRRIAEAGLSDRCHVLVRDYRELEGSEIFDKMVSVGMFEHVGRAMLPAYFEQAARLLKPGGVFLNHGISDNGPGADRRPAPARRSFSDVYVFPDGELVPLSETLRAAEHAGFEVRDVESLREHYALTLRHWVRRLESRADQARAVTDDITYRIWRLFMSFSAYGFAHNSLGVYQTLLAKPDAGRAGLPLTRADWYEIA